MTSIQRRIKCDCPKVTICVKCETLFSEKTHIHTHTHTQQQQKKKQQKNKKKKTKKNKKTKTI